MTAALETARALHRRGFAVIPVPFKSKKPIVKDWPNLHLAESDLPQHFDGLPSNIGGLLGVPSGGLVDVDLDAPEARALADRYLPPTPCTFGRKGSLQSHRLYRCDPLVSTTKYADPTNPDGDERAMLVELRSTGAQTILPGSIHASGEAIEWHDDGEPALVHGDDLRRCLAQLAAAALMARHWPGKGSRNDAALALAGGLARAGWPDDEARDFVENVALAAGDEEAGERGRTVESTDRRLAAGRTAQGWPTLATLIDGRVVDKVREWLGIRRYLDPATPRVTPQPQSERSWPEPPGDAAYSGLVGRVVAALDSHTEADPVAVLLTTLLAFGSAVGSGPSCVVGPTRHSLRDNGLLVGATAKARKGDATHAALSPFRLADPTWANTRVSSGLSSGEGLIWAVRNPIFKHEPIKDHGRIVDYQDVEIDPGVVDKRLLVIESEFAGCLKVMARQGNTLSPTLRQAWDSGDLRIMTKNSPATATGAHVSVLGHITIEELQRELADVETVNGFANRFLVAAVRRSKLLPDPEPIDPRDLEDLATELRVALEFGRQVGQIRRSPEAADLWRRIYADLSKDRPGLVGSLTARSEAHTLRLAALYALLDLSPTVEIDHLEAALEVVAFSGRSLEYIFGDATGDPVADSILRALVTNGELTRTQISDLFGRNVSAGRLDHALQLLLTTGRATTEERPTGGRPVEVWRPV